MKIIRDLLSSCPIEATAPCRIDMGGTLDITTFHYPLQHLSPCTFNIAIGLRTKAILEPYKKRSLVRVDSEGFDSAEYSTEDVPFNHKLGLIFAIAAYFRVEGVKITIESKSPPQSALGGSSSAAVAVIAAFLKAKEMFAKTKILSKREIALLTHTIEESVAGQICGFQDMLAACFGGVNVWQWRADRGKTGFKRNILIKKKDHSELERHLLLAYCGKPHVSKDFNGKWVKQFIAGKNRYVWKEIIVQTHQFVEALKEGRYAQAATHMNKETNLRRKITPGVLDGVGEQLVRSAMKNNCGARFTGAGGGGCIWAIGEVSDIDRLKPFWEDTVSVRKEACLLDVKIDFEGVRTH